MRSLSCEKSPVIAIDAATPTIVPSNRKPATQRLTAGRFGKNTNGKRRRGWRFKLEPKAHEQGQDHGQPDADGETPGAEGDIRYSERLF